MRPGISNHTKYDVEGLLHDCRMSKAEWAEELGVHPGTVYQWGDFPPQYAMVFLEERKKVLELKRVFAIALREKGASDGK